MSGKDKQGAPTLFPPGHFYSPVVQTAELRASNFDRRRRKNSLLALSIDYASMGALFRKFVEENGSEEFPRAASDRRRYHTSNDQFGEGDAFVLSSMIKHFRPSKIIEVGSGFSSAVILDALDDVPPLNTKCTFIDPHTERIEALLRAEDHNRVHVIRSMVQDVSLDVFQSLEAGDFLFLDTTHVSKTGSDVNFEIFDILPRLQPGVIVHFHDVFHDFEYPDVWIYEDNRSWNEIYLLRAFLMYNSAFEILYLCSGFALKYVDLIRNCRPGILSNPGGSLWLRKLAMVDNG